ncbi:MAG: HNH endonuclease signature motif containing protein, partial [Actinomycetota bacterium]
LDVGRAKRTATTEQRQALAAMHATCAHPHCNMPFNSCRIHHLDWWTRDLGPTDMDNLVPVCEHHHHEVHEGGWGLTMTPDRVATWTRPDGTTYWSGSTIDRHQPAA